MNNRYLQVARTYWRTRFLVSGAYYLIIAYVTGLTNGFSLGTAVASAACAGPFLGLLALHVRRQFGDPRARLMPGFARPHLVVVGLIIALVWIVIPSHQALLTQRSALALIALNSLGVLLFGLVVCRPTFIALLAAMPMGAFLMGNERFLKWSDEFSLGNKPGTSAVLIAAALVALAISAYRLLHLAESNVPVRDDMLAEFSSNRGNSGRWGQFVLNLRDAAMERRLASKYRRGWETQRWRVPMALSWFSFAVAIVVTLVAVALTVYASENRFMGWIIVVLAAGIMAVSPLGPWHVRRSMMSTELLYPVARTRYFRELIGALAWDVATWVGVATLLILLVNAGLYWMANNPGDRVVSAPVQVAVLWAAAILLFGAGVTALRFRYFVPLIITLGTLLTFALYLACVMVPIFVHGNDPHGQRLITLLLTGRALLMLAAVALGLFLSWLTYRRWLQMDLD